MQTVQKKRRRPCKGCRGAKAIRGVDRNAAAALFNRRKKACRACGVKTGCFIAHQTPCSQRRLLSDPKKFCPRSPPRW